MDTSKLYLTALMDDVGKGDQGNQCKVHDSWMQLPILDTQQHSFNMISKQL